MAFFFVSQEKCALHSPTFTCIFYMQKKYPGTEKIILLKEETMKEVHQMPVLLLLFVAGIILNSIASLLRRSKKQKAKAKEGRDGEEAVCTILKLLPQHEYTVLNDILIQGNGRSTQIDHIVVSRYGIFVIETKNYAGMITGHESMPTWVQTFPDLRTYEISNPLRQNWAHVSSLQDVLRINRQAFVPIVSFSRRCFLQVVSSVPVVYYDALLETILSHRTSILSDFSVQRCVSQIRNINKTSARARKEHIKYVKSLHANR